MARNKYIADPDDVVAIQEQLIQLPGYTKSSLKVHPTIERSVAAFRDVALNPEERHKGIDLEFDTSTLRPTIVSITTPNRITSVQWSSEVAGIVRDSYSIPDVLWVAHSGISADKPVVEKACNISLPLAPWRDSMVTHWLTNMHLTKAPSKEESEDSGSLGFMDLWTMASLTTDMYNWKECRGSICDGVTPCPKHDPIGYCGVDSWAGVVGWLEHQPVLRQNGVPEWLELETIQLIDMLEQMRQKGIKVKLHDARQINHNIEKEKDKIFPVDEHGNMTPFNPRSPKQVLDWFTENGLQLAKTDKDTIRKALDKYAKKYGFVDAEGNTDMEALGAEEELPKLLDVLYRTYEHKAAGKGLDPWFAEKYLCPEYHKLLRAERLMTADDLWVPEGDSWVVRAGSEALWSSLCEMAYIHPRLIGVGTSTSRLSSSRPNIQNVPARGFGDLVRRCIIARSPDLHLLKSDFSNLELRMCLYLAGVDQKVIGKDAFMWLVGQAQGGFTTAAALASCSERQIAKSVSHGADYLEGIKLYDWADLETSYVKRQIERGALKVYARKYTPELKWDWEFCGKVVCFTGANLAERLFGDRSLDNRKKALDIQEGVYFKNFFFIREWQKKVLDSVQDSGIIKSPVGHYMRLYGANKEDWAKIAVAFLGQGVSAAHVQGIMLKFYDMKYLPLLQVHDELVFEIPANWTDQQAIDFIRVMQEETHRLPGFVAPGKIYRGSNWLEYDEAKHGPYNGLDLKRIA